MIAEISSAVLGQIQTDVPGLQSYISYHDFTGTTLLPAFVLETNSSFTPDNDAGTEQLCMILGWRGYCVYDPLVTNAQELVRDLSLTVAHAIYKASRFGMEVGAAKITEISEETVKFTDQLAWAVDWTHEVRIGASVWDGAGTLPTEVYFSYEPDAEPPGSQHFLIE